MARKRKLDASRQIIAKPTARELKAQQNYALYQRVLRYRSQGKTHAQAAELAGASVPTVWRLEKRVRQLGIDGYLPQTYRCGRPSELVRLRVRTWMLSHVERHALQTGCGIAASWRQFACSPECPPALAIRIRRAVPKSFCRATQLRTVKLKIRVGRHVPSRISIAAALKEAI